MPNPKRKGYAFEREVVSLFNDLCIDAVRAWASDGRSIGMESNVDVVVSPFGDTRIPLQCKRRASIPSYIKPEDGVFGQVIRGDREEAYIVIRLSDFAEIIKDYGGRHEKSIPPSIKKILQGGT